MRGSAEDEVIGPARCQEAPRREAVTRCGQAERADPIALTLAASRLDLFHSRDRGWKNAGR
jgi:hypothetical protein